MATEDKRREAVRAARIRELTPELSGLYGAKEKPLYGAEEEIVEELLRESR